MSRQSIESYEAILGVTSSASTEEIKRAFRAKAKVFHPDINKSPDAQEQFILLTEAYDYFLNQRSANRTSTDSNTSYQEWYNQHRENVRERAREQAHMRYKEYMQTDEFKAVTALTNFFDLIGFLIVVFLLSLIPIISTLAKGIPGLVLSLLAIGISYKPILKLIRHTLPDTTTIGDSLRYLIRSKTFAVLLITLVNVMIIVNIGFQTLITPSIFFLSIIAPSLILFGVLKWFIKLKNEFRLFFSYFCIAPLLINAFFAFNFFFSTQPVTEKYSFHKAVELSSRGLRETSSIILENNSYSEYFFLRWFMNYEELSNYTYINYTFKEGYFGIKVMTDYTFE